MVRKAEAEWRVEVVIKNGAVTDDCCTDNNSTNYLVVFWSSELDGTVSKRIGATFSTDIDGLGWINVIVGSNMVAFRKDGRLVGVWFVSGSGRVN